MRKQLHSLILRHSLSLGLAVSGATTLTLSTVCQARPAQAVVSPANQQSKKHIDLVIALDTSSSMDGLIDAARGKMWDAVNLLAHAQPRPELRVGLISYGNTGYDPNKGWVRTEIDLTTDLDSVYAKLFALRTNGGEEYVARAIQTAADELSWTKDSPNQGQGQGQALRILFVAGNEPANQDPKVTLASALGDAHQRHILVNTIYCGSPSAGEAVGWQSVAHDSGGEFASIDQNHIARVATPVDAELAQLSQQLNGTYVAYGALGHAKAANQARQDENAVSAGAPAAASRASAKASTLYRADDWDLVDAIADKKKKLSSIPVSELPPPVAAMAPAQREEFVEHKAAERGRINARIAELAKQRDAYLKKQKPAADGVDKALSGNLQKEAEKAGYAF